MTRPGHRSPPRGSGQQSLHSELVAARLEQRAMFRALDSLGLAQSLPAALRRLMDLDADCAEALWVLSRSRGRHDLAAMERDTRASLAKLPAARAAVAALFSADEQALLDRRVELVRMTLSDADAYDDLPSTRPRR